MATKTAAAKASVYVFRYHSCRNITSPEDEKAGRRVYAGHAPASAVLDLEDNDNVREYLVDAPGKEKRSPTLVHQAIRKTLQENPEDFSILNGGMVLVARHAEVIDKEKKILLTSPSIINGSQTQGELKRHFAMNSRYPDFVEPSVKYELIVTTDDDLIAEVSIARNFQNDVRAISIAGRRGQLEELEGAVQEVLPNVKLRKSETDIVSDGQFLDTEKLIQVVFALMPEDLLAALDVRDGKVFTYSQKTRCLKLFQKIVDGQADPEIRKAYRYFLDIAGQAWLLYERWKSHAGFRGTRIRSIVRERGQIEDVPDGIVFPIIASLESFVKKTRNGWVIRIPNEFDEAVLIDTADQAYKEIAAHNPQTMGKSKACYSALLRVTSIYAKLIG